MTVGIAGECVAPWDDSKDPKIDVSSMAFVWDCDGPTGVKATMHNDPNCLTKGSWADYWAGVFGPGFKPSDSLVKGGAVLKLSMDKPNIIGSESAAGVTVTFAFQLNELHGCKPPPSHAPVKALASDL